MKEICVDVERTLDAKPKVSKVRNMNGQSLIAIRAKAGDYYSETSSPDGRQIILTKVDAPDGKDVLLDAYLRIVQEANPGMPVEEARGVVLAALEKQIRERR